MMKNIFHLQRRYLIILLLVFSYLLLVYKVGDRDLWAPDEDEYAQISREMIRTDNWVFPTVNGKAWTIKPVLYNWLVSAISLPYGDVDEFRARIFSALSGLGTVLVTFHIGEIAFTSLTGFLGALALASNLLFLNHARWAQTYMMSTFFATLAIWLFLRGYRQPEKRTASYLFMYIATGLGVLTMGPVNLAIPGLVIFCYLIAARDLKHILQMKPGWGILLFALLTLPWYGMLAMQSAYGYELLISTNFLRYFTALHHPQPFYYYFKDLGWAFFPWSVFLPGAFILAFSKRSEKDRHGLKFILTWVISLMIFFSISKGKRPQYILSIYPAFALLIGYLGDRAYQCRQTPDRFYLKAIRIPSIVLAALLFIVTLALPIGTWIYFKPMFVMALALSVIFGLFAVLIYVAWRQKQVQRLLLLPAGFMAVVILFSVHFLIPRMEVYKSPRPFCEEIVKRTDRGASWAMYQFYRAAYVYYTDSFAKVLDTAEQLDNFLNQKKQAIVVMEQDRYDHLQENLKNKVHLIYKRKVGSRPVVLVSNREE